MHTINQTLILRQWQQCETLPGKSYDSFMSILAVVPKPFLWLVINLDWKLEMFLIIDLLGKAS